MHGWYEKPDGTPVRGRLVYVRARFGQWRVEPGGGDDLLVRDVESGETFLLRWVDPPE
ncbi:MAG TPA: hypothetical protein VI997_12550 [Candidatus Thermoplasmatota archaeon]|nr:hypothetical protein [Candidatus Thermoplasmatota archaeon]